MKKMKKLIALVLCLAFVFSMSMMLTACPPEEKPEKADCNITLDFDSTKGNVTLDKESYKVGDKVVVTITSLDDYEIQSILLDTNNLTDLIRNGSYDFHQATYEFTASVDRTIRVQFQERGVWQNSNYVWTLNLSGYNTNRGSVVVSPNRSKYANNEAVTISITTTGGSVIKTFKVNGVDKKAEIVGGVYTFDITGNTNIEVKLDADLSTIANASVSSFDRDIDRDGRVLVDFWGESCYYCIQYMAPQLQQFVTNYNNGSAAEVALDMKIVKVRVSSDATGSTGRYPEYEILTRYASYYKGGLPFVVMIEDGEVIGTLHGAYENYNQFLNWIQNPAFN